MSLPGSAWVLQLKHTANTNTINMSTGCMHQFSDVSSLHHLEGSFAFAHPNSPKASLSVSDSICRHRVILHV